ncbi:6-pyruvoyl trahydropterin synthase family protein [Desulfomonile tiedjei]|uniref:6-carboxy-5,6,7,8-tetrahydropterin synthase n=1 Tax=Desulfomonile tiedjei (strain ATCC 49306 / DSM 6799 / DCB-1) TaxID=706587 RepID=I4C1M7_DESTA|nr:6-carboxytetrahydropterin synthase [Desulfomonile tiedjei]AFM23468.1 6-pyruvoyl-tetrahydropterin synthase [Desulfomonile tiedjei DSM 6799]
MSSATNSSGYKIAVQRDFIAQHYLFGGDWGAENQLHSHHYEVELLLEGETLDQHGYLVDIVDVENALDEIVSRFRDKTLNDVPDFSGLNPSIEHFSRIVCTTLSDRIKASNVSALEVKIWENEIAWAAFRQVRR